MDYHYTGRVNPAKPIPLLLESFLQWCRETIDGQLNGLLLNWYDSGLGHYIGPHRDSRKNLIEGSPIVTISLGQERVFRLRPWPRLADEPPTDLAACDGTVFVMPWATNLAFTHAVPPALRGEPGRRISITLRAFHPARLPKRRRQM